MKRMEIGIKVASSTHFLHSFSLAAFYAVPGLNCGGDLRDICVRDHLVSIVTMFLCTLPPGALLKNYIIYPYVSQNIVFTGLSLSPLCYLVTDYLSEFS